MEVRFASGSLRRMQLCERLRRVYDLASSTGHVARFILFGSFVTAKPEPNDVDVVMMMDDDFDASELKGEVALLFDHVVAQTVFGASVFWVRRLALWAERRSSLPGGKRNGMAVCAGLWRCGRDRE